MSIVRYNQHLYPFDQKYVSRDPESLWDRLPLDHKSLILTLVADWGQPKKTLYSTDLNAESEGEDNDHEWLLQPQVEIDWDEGEQEVSIARKVCLLKTVSKEWCKLFNWLAFSRTPREKFDCCQVRSLLKCPSVLGARIIVHSIGRRRRVGAYLVSCLSMCDPQLRPGLCHHLIRFSSKRLFQHLIEGTEDESTFIELARIINTSEFQEDGSWMMEMCSICYKRSWREGLKFVVEDRYDAKTVTTHLYGHWLETIVLEEAPDDMLRMLFSETVLSFVDHSLYNSVEGIPKRGSEHCRYSQRVEKKLIRAGVMKITV